MLQYLREARSQRRPLVLATANDAILAEPVFNQLQLFDALIASRGKTNLKGTKKLVAIQEYCEKQGWNDFAYAGDAWADLPIWNAAKQAIVVAPTSTLLSAVEQLPGEREIVVLAPRDRTKS